MKALIAFTLIIIMGAPFPALAQDCTDYSLYPHLVAQTATPDIATAIAIQGDRAYMGDYHDFNVLDIADPAQPVLTASLNLPVRVNGIAVSGALACGVGDAQNLYQMALFDITTPDEPVMVSTLDLPGRGFSVDLDGSLAYVACGGGGLLIVDVSEPANPVVLAHVPTTDVARGIEIAGGIAYLATNEAGLLIIDVSDPTGPVLLAHMPTTGYSVDVALAGDYCLVAEGDAGLAIVDVRNPVAPVEVGRWVGASAVRDVAVDQDMALLLVNGFFRAIDISRPAEPTLVYSVRFGSFGTTQALAVADGHAFLAARTDGLRVIDLGNRSEPAVLVELPTSPIRDIGFAQGFAFVLQDSNLMSVDMSDPAAPVTVGHVPLAGTTGFRCAITEDDLVFVTRTYDNNPAGPDEPGGLDVFDAGDPTDVRLLGSVDLDRNVMGVDVDGHHAYLACSNHDMGSLIGSLVVVDFEHFPLTPVVFDNLGLPSVTDIAVSNGLAVLACGESSIFLLDVSDPQAPQVLDTLLTPGGNPQSVAIAGDRAFVGGEGLFVCRLHESPSTAFIGAAFTGAAFTGATLIGATPSYGDAHRTMVDGDRVYTVGSNTLRVFDVTDPEDPVLAGGCYTDEAPRGLALTGNALLVGTAGGLDILPPQCPAALSGVEDTGAGNAAPTNGLPGLYGMRAHPNPFNPLTTVSFTLEHDQTVELAIYDLTGKRVAVLAHGRFAAGSHSLDWAGRNGQGQAVASGTYLLKMASEQGVQTEKMVLVR